MKVIHVLSIGNSFSYNAHMYLHDLAKSEGVQIETVNLMIGGCPLSTHFRNMVGDKEAYTLVVNGHSAEGFMTSIKKALVARDWDYVTIQQVSRLSYKEHTFYPYINKLAEYVRAVCPQAKLLIHQTWGYESGSEKILAHGFQTYDEMFAEIKKCYEKATVEIQADGMIPSGTAFQYALHHGIEKLHRDTFHADAGAGCFILALVWYRCLTGNDISGVTFRNFDVQISEEEYKIALEAAEFAVSQG